MIKKILLSVLLFALGLALGTVLFMNTSMLTGYMRERLTAYELVSIARALPFHLVDVTPYEIRVHDLVQVKKALDDFHADNGTYPVSKGWDGYKSSQGYPGADWIPALLPKYLGELPRDPRFHDVPLQQYLYQSNGKDYKLIANEPGDCEQAMKLNPDLVDPKRNYPAENTCGAYGFWTPGAAGW